MSPFSLREGSKSDSYQRSPSRAECLCLGLDAIVYLAFGAILGSLFGDWMTVLLGIVLAMPVWFGVSKLKLWSVYETWRVMWRNLETYRTPVERKTKAGIRIQSSPRYAHLNQGFAVVTGIIAAEASIFSYIFFYYYSSYINLDDMNFQTFEKISNVLYVYYNDIWRFFRVLLNQNLELEYFVFRHSIMISILLIFYSLLKITVIYRTYRREYLDILDDVTYPFEKSREKHVLTFSILWIVGFSFGYWMVFGAPERVFISVAGEVRGGIAELHSLYEVFCIAIYGLIFCGANAIEFFRSYRLVMKRIDADWRVSDW